MDAPVLLQTVVHEFHNPRRNCEPQALAAAAAGYDEGVDPHHGSVHIHQRAFAVTALDRCAGLDVDHGFGRVGLPGDRTHHAHRYRVLQSFWAPNRQNQLTPDAPSGLRRAAKRANPWPSPSVVKDRSPWCTPASFASRMRGFPSGSSTPPSPSGTGSTTRIRCAPSTTCAFVTT